MSRSCLAWWITFEIRIIFNCSSAFTNMIRYQPTEIYFSLGCIFSSSLHLTGSYFSSYFFFNQNLEGESWSVSIPIRFSSTSVPILLSRHFCICKNKISSGFCPMDPCLTWPRANLLSRRGSARSWCRGTGSAARDLCSSSRLGHTLTPLPNPRLSPDVLTKTSYVKRYSYP